MKERIVCHEIGKDPLYKIWHASEEHLLMYFYSGGGSIVCKDKIFPIKKGALVWISAETFHYTIPDEPEKYDRSKLYVSVATLHSLAPLLGEKNRLHALWEKGIVYAEIPLEEQKKADEIFCSVFQCQNRDEKELLYLCACLALFLLLDRYSGDFAPSEIGTMGKALRYLNENITSEIKIDLLAQSVNMSKFHFCRLFKKHTGTTVMEYVLKTRLVLAKNELRKSNLSITEISEKYGFSSVSYFCRAFKKEEGLSPLRYRKARPFGNPLKQPDLE